MAPTPSSKIIQSLFTPSKTPHSKHRLNFGGSKSVHPSPNPNTTQKEITPAEHPVEVIGRIRDYPDRKDKPSSSLLISTDGQTIRVRSDIVYRDFSLDGVSLSENEDLEEFYKKFVEERINGVKLGSKCTIMMYGPTGSGKSHTMFGCSKQPGIVYRALKDILGEGEDNGNCHENPSSVSFVHVTVLEIYNEEIYDLLSNNNGGGISFGWPKGNTPKVRLEVMGKRAKNATFISGTDAGKLSKEVAKVEKRRIVKSTLCNERSSRSHCLIILDVPSVGGRLMLVDMAGSENIEQAGQTGVEAKMQTAKINHGNIALKRVVESIANGDSHVPFRDSKLTMLLQDSFEDDKSKILMILCASPDPKELHKTISTLEYGAKAKCIVRNTNITTQKDKIGTEDTSCVILGSRIEAMDQFIYKLQMENKIKEKECDKIQKELLKKQEEVVQLKSKLEQIEERALVDKEEEINIKVNERTSALKLELEKKLQGCQKMADELVEKGRRRMEERILQHQQEVEMFRQRLEEIEFELRRSQNDNSDPLQSIEGSKIFQKFTEIYGDNGEQGMEKSMDLDMDDLPIVRDVREINVNSDQAKSHRNNSPLNSHFSHVIQESDDSIPCRFTETRLSTVFEEEEEGEAENVCEKEVDKEILEETTVPYTQKLSPLIEPQDDAALARLTRIQNIFMLCGNNRELAQQHTQAEFPVKTKTSDSDIHQVTPTKLCENIINDQLFADLSDGKVSYSQKNMSSRDEERDELIEVYVKWETSKENNQGQLITKLKIPKNSSLTELRKVIKTQIGEENNQQEFSFLMLGDPTGAPVSEEKEETIQVRKLPVIPNQTSVHLACLRQNKKTTQQRSSYLFPFNPLENKLPLSPTECFSPKCKQILSSNAQRITTIPPLI